jgi:hypothetical protein
MLARLGVWLGGSKAMQITTSMLSPEGEWLADGPALAAAIGCTDADFNVAAFAVRNLGYIRFEAIENILLEIQFHPIHVTRRAIAAAQERIAAAPPGIFRLRHLEEEWQTDLLMSPRQAALRLEELCRRAATPLPHERFIAHDLGPDRLLLDGTEGNPRPLLQKWRTSFHRFDETVIPFAVKRGIASTTMLIGLKRGVPDPVFQYIGDAFWGFGRDFHLRAIGEKVQHQPDPSYGEWVVQFYREAAASWLPRYDYVEASIENSERGRLYRYERLILPWSTPSGDAVLTVSSRFVPAKPDAAGDSDEPKWLVKKAAKSS